MNVYEAGILVVGISGAYLWWSHQYWKRKIRDIQALHATDPYLPSVRRIRAERGSLVAVSIKDCETGKFVYYPRGSENRMSVGSTNRLRIDE